jgi:hypothetical protein
MNTKAAIQKRNSAKATFSEQIAKGADLVAFAKPADVTPEEKASAAKAAGFKELADISFYLRSLISGHHDTLAVKVQ